MLAEGEPRKQQVRLSHGPALPVLDVGRLRPRLLVGQIRMEPRYGRTHPAAVGQRESPEVIAPGGEDLAERRHLVELEDRVAVGLHPRQFLGD